MARSHASTEVAKAAELAPVHPGEVLLADFIDAFYSFDHRRLAGALAAAETSAPRIVSPHGHRRAGTPRDDELE